MQLVYEKPLTLIVVEKEGGVNPSFNLKGLFIYDVIFLGGGVSQKDDVHNIKYNDEMTR